MLTKGRLVTAIAAVVMSTCGVAGAGTAVIDFDFDSSTPVGSWQEREMVVTNEKGKQSVSVMRVSYLGDEDRNGEKYAWIETQMSNYKVKKKGRKQQGDPIYIKVLMKKSVLKGDIANALGNFNELADEVIMQTGDSQPMRIKGAGSMMGGMAQAIGLKVTYELSKQGSESVTVPAGTFECDRYKGQGSSSAKVVFKTINVESTATQWISGDVPFGVVKVISDDVVDGEPQHSQSELVAFGTSGARSMITGEPQEMPDLGGIFGG